MNVGDNSKKGGIGVCGLIWALLIAAKLLGFSQLSWAFTLAWPIVFVVAVVLFLVGLGAFGVLLHWILGKRKV